MFAHLNKPRVAVVRAQGTITSARGANKINAQKLDKALTKAFKTKNVKAVALVVNSPGGSAAQSSLIYKRIIQLKKQYNVPVYAFVEDAAASGGFYIACAADKIYVDENSVVGSVGVVAGGFGLQDFIAKHKIERRVYTAGKNKVILDPFQAEKKEDVAILDDALKQIHGTFVDVVKESRGNKLSKDVDLFEGDIWIGKKAVEVGFADEVGAMHGVLAEKFGKDVKIIDKSGGWGSFAEHWGMSTAFAALSGVMSGGGTASAEAASAGVGEVSGQALVGAISAAEDVGLWRSVGVSHHP